MGLQYDRMVVKPLLVASLVLLAPAWLDWWIEGGSPGGVPYPVWLAGVLVLNLALTLASPRDKRAVAARLQKFVINPVVRTALRLRIPIGLCLVETTGRRSGLPRRVPVGNGLVGSTLWVVAEHGAAAGYVRNICADPRVRVLIRRPGARRSGVLMTWSTGRATVLPDDDPYARQRAIGGWRHPLRAMNAMAVRVLGSRPVTVRIDLDPAPDAYGMTQIGDDQASSPSTWKTLA